MRAIARSAFRVFWFLVVPLVSAACSDVLGPADDTPATVLSGDRIAGFSWVPGEQRIVFVRPGTFPSIHVLDVETGQVREIVHLEDPERLELPSFGSAIGSHISMPHAGNSLYYATRPFRATQQSLEYPELYRVSLDGGSPELVFADITDPRAFAVSPDGRHIAIGLLANNARRLLVRDLATGADTYFDVTQIGAITWAPDSRSLVIDGFQRSEWIRPGTGESQFLWEDQESGFKTVSWENGAPVRYIVTVEGVTRTDSRGQRTELGLADEWPIVLSTDGRLIATQSSDCIDRDGTVFGSLCREYEVTVHVSRWQDQVEMEAGRYRSSLSQIDVALQGCKAAIASLRGLHVVSVAEVC